MDPHDSMSKGQLIFIGLGLFDEYDISFKGLTELKKCDKVFVEFYTSQLAGLNTTNFKKMIGKKVNILTREETEKGDILLAEAQYKRIALLSGGDPMTATTHIDLRIRAYDLGIPTRIIHGNSIITAAPALLGLQNYKFGRTTTLVFPEKGYFPTSPYTTILDNQKAGLHSLVLLDIKAEEDIYMTANQGLQLLLEIEKKENRHLFTSDSLACVVAQAGSLTPTVAANSIKNLLDQDFGPALHILVIPGSLHFMELEALEKFAGLPKTVSKKLQKI